jgi:hypothetical protein
MADLTITPKAEPVAVQILFHFAVFSALSPLQHGHLSSEIVSKGRPQSTHVLFCI